VRTECDLKVVEPSESVHVIERRLFIGTVDACTKHALRVRG